jgi:L-aspartate oxidase
VRARANVDLFERAFAVDLVVEQGRCTGAVVELRPGAGLTRIGADTVVIAAGGAGQLWATTSNPPAATADGLAMALRAGVAVADVEFVQFHPTVLALSDSTPFLVSEAVRGEGAYLRGASGERFMVDRHPLAELAPRDVVARGIQHQMAIDASDHVYLDLRHLDADAMRKRFPTIAAELSRRGLDLATDLIPVAPAAHYFMGGIAATTDGETSLPGLLALGEASCTGVHGANRLASNSLLEGLVFGLHAATHHVEVATPGSTPHMSRNERGFAYAGDGSVTPELSSWCERIQRAMSRYVAVVRDAEGLAAAAAEVDTVLASLAELSTHDRALWETRNLAVAARAVISAATLREESRGAHFRSDFPTTDPAFDGQHLAFGGDAGSVWQLTTLDEARRAVLPEAR